MSTNLNVKLITRNLGDELIAGMQHATGIYIMTSFLMQSGVNLLAPHLKKALDRGAEVKMIAGDYLYITQPEGLRKLLSIDDRLEARLWRSMGTSFHPKAYLFDYENGEGLLIVGSSNFSFSALKTGYEWNLAMNAQAEPYTFQNAMDQFMENLYHASTLPLNEDTIALYEEEYLMNHRKNPELQRQVIEMEEAEADIGDVEIETTPSDEVSLNPIIQPRTAQAIALEALDTTIEEEYDRAMVVMATGLGKTYLAAFLAKKYRRVLFVAHREEILQQAANSFRHVLPERSHGLYNGQSKDRDSDCIFASIYTLGMKKHREAFNPDTFDLIVIDEFHHAAARSYRSVMEYFHPQFMLGITATPDRMDGQDVYALCGGNVAYRIHFIEAIRREWLSPFQYYGVHDDTDYSGIRWIGTHYDEEQLLAVQLREEYAERVYEAWAARRQTRTIAFCSSIQQADYLNDYFRIRGSQTLSLHSRTKEMSRTEAIRRLDAGEMDVLFTVDLFNEGTDIPSVDTLLFVRPTESLTVFTQQVGRGLRMAEGKSHCVIIDLIGNYRNADVKLRVFGEYEEDGSEVQGTQSTIAPILPESCSIQLDTAVINLLEQLSRKRAPRREKLHRDFLDLKSELGRIPTYLELHLQGRSGSNGYRDEFGSYVGFLYWAEMLDEKELQTYERYEIWLRDVERTAMSKSYKMIVLAYMLDRGIESWTESVTAEEAASFFHHYLTEKEYRKRIDFSGKEAKKMWAWNEQTRIKVAKLIADMPMSKWAGAKGSQVSYADGYFELAFDVEKEDTALLHRWTSEVCEYRLHLHFERRDQHKYT
ncbi:DEAD/DEAH box helicase family protein [Saccharibacillus sp. JS10]|uniref:DEAD/DEAH box helicase family protein n=1 Tax=Saccharibacillus sp. JS10 TaxID=2950552 RepID=UPI002109D629|nr:DEAD/DEAH box helicase family protein [Saccharibacillus sp. JS10]MCQ4086569.1 DEAD/DEAH box helicase family protein [Saccharibacillus sp. JS10]